MAQLTSVACQYAKGQLKQRSTANSEMVIPAMASPLLFGGMGAMSADPSDFVISERLARLYGK